MPRYRRIFLQNVPLHVVQRGHNRQVVFSEPQDYQHYLRNLIEAKRKYAVSVLAYCLMTNHIHLIVVPTQESSDVSKFMRLLSARQTRYVNKLESRTGTLWEGRFKASIIDSEAYLLACYRYVDLNPLRAGLVDAPEHYHWSSYCILAGLKANNIIDSSQPYTSLGVTRHERQSRYREWVLQGTATTELALIRTALKRNQVTGSESFAKQISKRIGRRISIHGPGRPKS